jgi:hypothetical protein
VEPLLGLVVDQVYYSQDKQGFGAIVQLNNETTQSMQLLEWTLEFPGSQHVSLAWGQGPPSFLPGAPWLPRPPFVVEAQRGTGRGALFFPAPASWAGELPGEPLHARLKGRVFPSLFLELDLEIYSLKTLSQHPLPEPRQQSVSTLRSPLVAPSGAGCLAREVFSLHGIRTRGKWQKEIVPLLSRANLNPVPLDYGYFMAVRLLFSSSRSRRVDWFRDEYMKQCDRLRCSRPSIIAHSFGTYLLAAAMEKYPQLVFDRIVLCGSIIRRDFPWQELITRGQVRAVLNQYGGRDAWVCLVEWFVPDAGPLGGQGFDSNAVIMQQNHPKFNHSDYFSLLSKTGANLAAHAVNEDFACPKMEF